MGAVAVAYRSMAGEFGIFRATSVGPGAWSNVSRMNDYFAHEVADSVGTPSGETEIVIDQGTDVSKYVSPSLLFIPARHTLTVPAGFIWVEHAASDSWPGTPINLAEVIPVFGPEPGVPFIQVMDPPVPGSGNRWWRVRFTDTSAKLEIPELWLSELVILGANDPDPVEASRGNAADPASFDIVTDVEEALTPGGVRSASSFADERRRFALNGSRMTDLAYQDWARWRTNGGAGLRKFVFRDPLGDYWLARTVSGRRTLYRSRRWDVGEEIEEVL